LTYAQDSGTLMAEAMGNWLTQRHKEHKEENLVASCLGVSRHSLTRRHRATEEKHLGAFVSLCE